MDITKLYKKQISMTEWFENIKHVRTEDFREEDNTKRERMKILNEVVGLPFDKPYQFSAQDVADRTEAFTQFLAEHGDELCALRLIPEDVSLPKLRMRGHTIKNVLRWFAEQTIDPVMYRADFVPHPEKPTWSSIFMVNEHGIFGEIIAGGHHQLTQGFHDAGKPIAFSYDFSEWKFSKDERAVIEHAQRIVNEIVISDLGKREELRARVAARFVGKYLQGYFETVESEDQGLWFVDYNRIMADLYSEGLPVVTREPDTERLLSGQPASAGVVQGKVRIVRPEDLDSMELANDELLVCEFTTPDYFHVMQQAGGIITNSGGTLSHAAIVARELGKPCVVGTGNATELLQDGDIVELDAGNGIVRKI